MIPLLRKKLVVLRGTGNLRHDWNFKSIQFLRLSADDVLVQRDSERDSTARRTAVSIGRGRRRFTLRNVPTLATTRRRPNTCTYSSIYSYLQQQHLVKQHLELIVS